ncbi:adhesion regulating molecule [Clavulina sp. PMI_390]|nr:adhesion regulating molecule [Clavulina sp. PMI_390]
MATTILYGPIRAGRAIRESDSSDTVVPQAPQGEITITENDDGLVHFNWINRQTRVNELDLIIFPEDASFVKVTQSPGGRVHVLKFSSSDQRYFFWFQDSHTGAHESYAANLTGLLEDPEFTVDHAADAAGRSATASTSSAPAASSSSSTAAPAGGPTPEQLEQFRRLVAGLPSGAGSQMGSGLPELSLSDVLSPTALAPLFSTASPAVLRTIFPTLPSDMPIPPSPEALRRVVESPQFQAQVRALDRALQTGLVGSLVVGLGLPEEAGLGIGPFLEAIKKQAKDRKDSQGSGSGESMETD